MSLADFIDEEWGELEPWQRRIIDAMFPPPPPPPPPSNWTKVKRWFRRNVLRRRYTQSLSNFDRALREVYAPGLREQINASNPIMSMIAKDTKQPRGHHAVWTIRDEACES